MRAAAAHAIGAGAQRCGAVCRWNWRCPSTCLDRWIPCCEHVVNTHLNQLRPGCNHRRTKEVLGSSEVRRSHTAFYLALPGSPGPPARPSTACSTPSRRTSHWRQPFQVPSRARHAFPDPGAGCCGAAGAGGAGGSARGGGAYVPPETPRRVGADSLAPLDREPQAEQQSSAREVSRWWVRWSAAGGRADHAQRRRRTAAAPHTHL